MVFHAHLKMEQFVTMICLISESVNKAVTVLSVHARHRLGKYMIFLAGRQLQLGYVEQHSECEIKYLNR